jgi:hypothetical protein
MPRGRPRIHATEADRKAALVKAKEKTKNITLDSDLVEALNIAADRLEAKFGFRPTLSQTVRHLIKQA